MKLSWFYRTTSLLLGIATAIAIFMLFPSSEKGELFDNSYLTRPFPAETVLITSAGQSTDVYVVQNAVNRLRVHNLFMPQATTEDMDNIQSVMIVLGQSDVGYKLAKISQDQEKDRIKSLVDHATENKIPVMLVYLGQEERMNTKTMALYRLIENQVEYMVATPWSGHVHKLQKPFSVSWIESAESLEDILATVLR